MTNDYEQAERILASVPQDVKKTMERSIEKYIRKYGKEEINSTKAGACILSWKESKAWNEICGREHAKTAFGIFLKAYLAERNFEWEDPIVVETERGPQKSYLRKTSG